MLRCSRWSAPTAPRGCGHYFWAQASLLALLLFFWAPKVTRANLIATISPNDPTNTTTITLDAPPNTNFGPKSWQFPPFAGRLVTFNDTDRRGAAVLLPWASGFSFETLARREYNAGAAAVITAPRFAASGIAGWTEFFTDGTSVRDIKIPVVEISQFGFGILLRNLSIPGTSINVTITCCDRNEWAEWNSSGWMIGFSVVAGGFSTFVFAYSFLKLAILVRQASARFSIGILVLLIVCLGNLFRSIYIVVDPLVSRKIFTNPWLFIFWTFSAPFSIIAALSVTFYWLELITRSNTVVVSSFLSRLLWPFVGASCLIMSVELASSSLRGLNYSVPTVIVVTGIAYIIIVSVVLVLFLITGRTVLKQLTHSSAVASSSEGGSQTRRLRRATIKLMISTFGLVGAVICATLIALANIVNQIRVSHGVWFYLFISLTFSDFMLVWAVRASFGRRTRSERDDSSPQNTADTNSPPQTPNSSRQREVDHKVSLDLPRLVQPDL